MYALNGRALVALCALIAACAWLPSPIARAIDDYPARDDEALRLSFDEMSGETSIDPLSQTVASFDGATWTRGVRGGAVGFNGFAFDHQVVIRGSGGQSCPPAVCTLETGTISLWFRFDSHPAPNGVHPLVYVGDGIGSPAPYGFIIEIGHGAPDDRRLFFTVYGGNLSPSLCFDTRFHLEPGRWYHFAAVVGDGFNTGFLDGEELIDRRYNYGNASSQVFFSDFFSPAVFQLGRDHDSSPAYLDGVLDEFAIHSRALEASEIREYYTSMLPHFVRGDADGDATTTLSDAVVTLAALFESGSEIGCLAAADANADDHLDVADAVYVLLHLFSGGSAPPAPYPDCASTVTTIPCEQDLCGPSF